MTCHSVMGPSSRSNMMIHSFNVLTLWYHHVTGSIWFGQTGQSSDVPRNAGVPDDIIQDATLASQQRRAIEHLKASRAVFGRSN